MNAGRAAVVLMLVVGLLGSWISGATFYTRLLILALLLSVGSWLWVGLAARALRFQRRAETSRARVGDMLREQFEVYNAGRLPVLWLEVRTAPLSGSRLLTLVGGRQRRFYVARTWLTRRGSFPLGPTTLIVSDPLGLFRVRRQFAATRSLVVFPMVYPITTFLSPPGLLPGGHVIRRKTLEITPHAAGLRDYLPGDPMKRIHWPTSVRRGRLMVKEFEQDPQAEVWLFLDAQQSVQAGRPLAESGAWIESRPFMRKPELSLPPSTLEYGIAVAASLAHFFIAQKRTVGLVVRDRAHTVIPAERGERQENKILETLAFLEGRGDLPLSALLRAQAHQIPRRASVVLITPSTSPDLLLATAEAQLRRLQPLVILFAAETFGGGTGAASLAQRLKAQGVPVCLIPCEAEIGQVLSDFAASNLSQEVFPWPRPALSPLI